jgi:hypothetical protein
MGNRELFEKLVNERERYDDKRIDRMIKRRLMKLREYIGMDIWIKIEGIYLCEDDGDEYGGARDKVNDEYSKMMTDEIETLMRVRDCM